MKGVEVNEEEEEEEKVYLLVEKVALSVEVEGVGEVEGGGMEEVKGIDLRVKKVDGVGGVVEEEEIDLVVEEEVDLSREEEEEAGGGVMEEVKGVEPRVEEEEVKGIIVEKKKEG